MLTTLFFSVIFGPVVFVLLLLNTLFGAIGLNGSHSILSPYITEGLSFFSLFDPFLCDPANYCVPQWADFISWLLQWAALIMVVIMVKMYYTSKKR